MFYSKTTGGFYNTAIHGTPKLRIIDPAFTWPQVEVETDDGVVLIDDPEVVPPTVEIDNPNTKIPADAVEITATEHQALIDGQASGKRIVADASGLPVLEDPPKPTAAQVWEYIKAARDHRTEQGGYEVGTKWFHSDQKSRSQQLGLVILGANIPAGLQWKTMDGSFVTMTQQLAGQVLAAAAASDQAIFAAAETHKAAMEASADPSAYDFSGGWPATFAG